EPVEQRERRVARRGAFVLRRGDQRVAVEPEGGEPLRVGRGPVGDDLDRALRVELDAEVAAVAERLWRGAGAGDLDRAGRDREAVEVPLEPRAGGDPLGVVGLDRRPAELWLRR